ncbi:hypothetical protein GYMLUDRAFT_263243 [Collybiopsis luxurians FD-317 M1]|uniref:Mug135-like C-terminal domain-containing protein n=1 Tax=Collybiopsis luxurians FD-317 M1 TaxID=944289 RepID=A0A0D0B1W8_9AGAR|nr:hypothetical protein GYMLUDRAFT_263243 [Collybiopsis luxurians FD-317 M1]
MAAQPQTPTDFLVQDQDHKYGSLLNVPLQALNNPISRENVMQAQDLKEQALTERGKHLPNSAEYVNEAATVACVAYCESVVAKFIGGAAAPQWFQNFQQNIAEQLDRVEEKLDKINTHLAKVTILAARDSNDKRKTQPTGPFHQVPFEDGTWPWDEEVPGLNNDNIQLPPLINDAAIEGLDGPQSSAYFLGYFPTQPIPCIIAQRKNAIRTAIGRGD